jgi:hypothetical protein
VDSLVLKVVVTPVLIGAASLAARRWGPAVSGWLVALPLTSAPVTLFLALDHGPGFAATASTGTMAGAISQAAFCVGYAWVGRRCRWPITLLAASLAFGLCTAALSHLVLPLALLLLTVVGTLVMALRLMPAGGEPSPRPSSASPGWDLPARMAVATGIVLLLTGAAPVLGPRLTGLLSPYPLYAAILAAFAHHRQGPAPAAEVLRGLLLGLFSFAGFFVVVAGVLETAGIGPAFAAALALALAVQAGALWVLRRGGRMACGLRECGVTDVR